MPGKLLLQAATRLISVLAVASASAGDPPAPAAGPASAAGRLASEVLRAFDGNGDGELSRQELMASPQSGVDAGAAGQLAALPREELFAAMDGDGSGSVDAGEAERALRALTAGSGAPEAGGRKPPSTLAGLLDLLTRREEAIGSGLRSRAAPATAGARRLDDSAGGKVPDPRCEAPKGFPTRPEGFVCINETALIYCSEGKRWRREEVCGWKGRCQAGIVPDGGCKYPLCSMDALKAAGASFCSGDDDVYWCHDTSINSRMEMQSVHTKTCSPSKPCRSWDDGRPPSRRRRTQTCIRKIFGDDICWDDPEDPSYAECTHAGSTFV
mmetsp:Transcript_116441/g.362708  ORF Transcript_116441/g.362708 Transcript_116441/m.362708 type:complete len:326 (-) Transcript_116441:41-1018(-)